MYFNFFCKTRSSLCLIAYCERCCPQKCVSVQEHITPVLHQYLDQASLSSTQAPAVLPPAEPPVVKDLHKYLGNGCQCFTWCWLEHGHDVMQAALGGLNYYHSESRKDAKKLFSAWFHTFKYSWGVFLYLCNPPVIYTKRQLFMVKYMK